MKIILKNISLLFFFELILFSYSTVYAQNEPITDYLKSTIYYSPIYNGQIEPGYSHHLYKNYPYYHSDELTEAVVFYKKNKYPNQKVRIDLFLEKLIILVPENLYKVVVNSEDIEKVIIYDKTFLWLTPPPQSKLKAGFYISLYEGSKLKLFCKEKYELSQKTEGNKIVYYFNDRIQYYLLLENQYHIVKNTKSFAKLFPQYKKEINKFAKDHKLSFEKDKDHSLSLLAEYCEELETLNKGK